MATRLRSNSPDHYSIGTRSPILSPKTKNQLPQLVSIRFQVLFHSPSGVLFTFPSRYWFAIGHQIVFSLTPWSGRIRTGFHVSRVTWELGPESRLRFAYGTIARCGQSFQTVRLQIRFVTFRSEGTPTRPNPATPKLQRVPALT